MHLQAAIADGVFLGNCGARSADVPHPMRCVQTQPVLVIVPQQGIEHGHAAVDAALAQDAPATATAMRMLLVVVVLLMVGGGDDALREGADAHGAVGIGGQSYRAEAIDNRVLDAVYTQLVAHRAGNGILSRTRTRPRTQTRTRKKKRGGNGCPP